MKSRSRGGTALPAGRQGLELASSGSPGRSETRDGPARRAGRLHPAPAPAARPRVLPTLPPLGARVPHREAQGGRGASRRLGAPSHKDRKCPPAAFRSRGLRNLRAPRPWLRAANQRRGPFVPTAFPPRQRAAPRGVRPPEPCPCERSPRPGGPRSPVGCLRPRPAPPPLASRTPALLAHLQSNRKVLRFPCGCSAFPVAPTKINAWVNGLNGKQPPLRLLFRMQALPALRQPRAAAASDQAPSSRARAHSPKSSCDCRQASRPRRAGRL